MILANKVLDLAKKDSCLVSTHFLESKSEREWLTSNCGWFEEFYKKNFHVTSPKPFYSIETFLKLFEGLKALFVHCMFAKDKELQEIAKNNHYVISCVRSNRLLSGSYLDLNTLRSLCINPMFATDGNSSNNNLNMLDELRAALFAYPQIDIEVLTKILILGTTFYPARALGLNNGTLAVDKLADIAIFECPKITQSYQAPLQFLLHAKHVKKLYINGTKAYG